MGTKRKVGKQVFQVIHGSKPTKTHSNHRSIQNTNWGYFWWNFRIYGEKTKSMRNPWQPKVALIPDDKVVNLLGGPIFTDLVVKSMGNRGEREKVAEANTHLAKNTMNTRKTHTIQGRLLPNGSHRSDKILARKDRSTCSLKSTSEREEHLGEGLHNLETRHRTPRPCSTMDA